MNINDFNDLSPKPWVDVIIKYSLPPAIRQKFKTFEPLEPNELKAFERTVRLVNAANKFFADLSPQIRPDDIATNASVEKIVARYHQELLAYLDPLVNRGKADNKIGPKNTTFMQQQRKDIAEYIVTEHEGRDISEVTLADCQGVWEIHATEYERHANGQALPRGYKNPRSACSACYIWFLDPVERFRLLGHADPPPRQR